MEHAMSGRVYLVGAGPGDPGLLTLRAAELLRSADVVLYDRLVSDGILAMAGASATKEYVGRAVGDDASHQDSTNEAMARHAGEGRTVVRLKGGDPNVFGRGGEEAEFLRSRGIECELVPGITSGLASATYAGIPITHRGTSSSVALVTGHEDPTKETESVRWEALAGSVDTIVVLMGLGRIRAICARLAAGGLDASTPVAVIQEGTTPRQAVERGTLADIADRVSARGMRAPAIIIVGAAAALDVGARGA